jgi:hypothetical protein
VPSAFSQTPLPHGRQPLLVAAASATGSEVAKRYPTVICQAGHELVTRRIALSSLLKEMLDGKAERLPSTLLAGPSVWETKSSSS